MALSILSRSCCPLCLTAALSSSMTNTASSSTSLSSESLSVSFSVWVIILLVFLPCQSSKIEPDVDVTDQAIVSHHLCIYCIILLPAPKLLLMLVLRKIPGCFLKFEHHTIHTKCKSRKVELLPHSVCCLFHFHICRHVDVLFPVTNQSLGHFFQSDTSNKPRHTST